MIRILVGLIVAWTTWTAGIAGAQPAKLELELGGPRGAPMGPREAEPPIIEVLTFGAGARIFEKFGHAAICLRYHDPRNAPICFNYGVTNFNEGPRMIWSFLRSTHKFWAEPSTWGELFHGGGRPHGMIGFYSWENRDIWSQRLPLTGDQARAIEAQVWDSLREEKRYYLYDHFFDNCTTRLRDMIDAVTGGKLREGTDAAYPLTFREMGHRGLAGMPELLALTDFIVGRQADDTPTVWQAMFHPDVLRQILESRLGVKPELIYQHRGEPFPVDGPSGRWQMLLLAVVLALPLLLARRVSRRAWLERVALVLATLPLVLWGLVIYALVIISPIPCLHWNEAVFVLVPFDLALPFLREAVRRRYARLRIAGLALVSLLCAIGVLHQPLWVPILTAFLPMAILAFDLHRRIAGAEVVEPAQ